MNLVSIIIPTFNRYHFIGDTLDSILVQTYKNWECIVVDDYSTDYTKELLMFYQEKDSRIKYLPNSEPSRGASLARNLGLDASKGKFIQFLDSDDVIAINKIEEQVSLLSNQHKYAIATCKWDIFENVRIPANMNLNKLDYKNFSISKDYFDLIGSIGGFFPPHCFLVRRELINFSGYWNQNLTLNDDGEFFFRMILNSSGIFFAENTYVRYRIKICGDNLSILNSEQKAISLVNSWKIIEALYCAKFSEKESLYLKKKKSSVYSEIKRFSPTIINQNIDFFHNQINADTFSIKFQKLLKRIKRRIKTFF